MPTVPRILSLLLLLGVPALAQPGLVIPDTPARSPVESLGTDEPWGGGLRFTALSGIGALPGVNYGGEIAATIRNYEYFGELAFGWWKPETTYLVTEMPRPVQLGLDVWTARAGWASMQMPLRAWALVEVGEIAGAPSMPGVIARMMSGDTPQARRWEAVGAGFGVAWPMSDHVRLFGTIELAVPIERPSLMLDSGPYRPDELAARSCAGLELGWR